MNNTINNMQQEAERILSDLHNNEHMEKMRVFRLIHNGILLLFTTILCCVFFNLWILLLLLFWELNPGSSDSQEKESSTPHFEGGKSEFGK